MSKSELTRLILEARKKRVDDAVITIKAKEFEQLAVALYHKEYANINIWKILKKAQIQLMGGNR